MPWGMHVFSAFECPISTLVIHNVQFRKAKILTHINVTFLCYFEELCRWITIAALCKWSETLLVLFCVLTDFVDGIG